VREGDLVSLFYMWTSTFTNSKERHKSKRGTSWDVEGGKRKGDKEE
jgi:hypothetical protein